MSKISIAKGSIKGGVTLLNLSRSVSEECHEKLLTEPSSNKAWGYDSLTDLLKSMQKKLNNLQDHVKEMKLDIKANRQSFLTEGTRIKSNKCQDCLVNNCACVYYFFV